MNWEAALEQTWTKHFALPPQLGVSDCCQFVADYFWLVTSRSIPEFKYETETEAKAIVSEHGGALGLLTSILGQPHTEPLPGDIVLCESDSFIAPGVFMGKWVCCAIHERGVGRIPKRLITHAWSL